MEADEYISSFLEEGGIPFSQYCHEAIYTVEGGLDIAGQLGLTPSKCLLLVNRQHQYYLLLWEGNAPVDLRLVARAADSSRLSFASREDMARLLRTAPGAVSPLGLVFDTSHLIRFIIDARLLKLDALLLAPCVNDKSIVMNTHDFTEVFLPAVMHQDYITL